jgi:hypothetical protein
MLLLLSPPDITKCEMVHDGQFDVVGLEVMLRWISMEDVLNAIVYG